MKKLSKILMWSGGILLFTPPITLVPLFTLAELVGASEDVLMSIGIYGSIFGTGAVILGIPLFVIGLFLKKKYNPQLQLESKTLSRHATSKNGYSVGHLIFYAIVLYALGAALPTLGSSVSVAAGFDLGLFFEIMTWALRVGPVFMILWAVYLKFYSSKGI